MLYIVAGTGSRSFQPSPKVERELDQYLMKVWTEHDEFEIMSGMAEGFDEFLARRAIALGFDWQATVPNKGYGKYYWGEHSVTGRDRYAEFDELLSKAKRVIYVCRGIKKGGVHSNFIRNQYMVDKADAFVVGAPITKGTAHCLNLINMAQKPFEKFES